MDCVIKGFLNTWIASLRVSWTLGLRHTGSLNTWIASYRVPWTHGLRHKGSPEHMDCVIQGLLNTWNVHTGPRGLGVSWTRNGLRHKGTPAHKGCFLQGFRSSLLNTWISHTWSPEHIDCSYRASWTYGLRHTGYHERLDCVIRGSWTQGLLNTVSPEQTQKHMDCVIQGLLNTWIASYRVSWTHGLRHTGFPEHMDCVIQGLLNTWIASYRVSWTQGWLHTGYPEHKDCFIQGLLNAWIGP
jgi:hypothetical protein